MTELVQGDRDQAGQRLLIAEERTVIIPIPNTRYDRFSPGEITGYDRFSPGEIPGNNQIKRQGMTDLVQGDWI